VPLAISNAVMRALAKEPEDRFATAEEFLQAMQMGPAASGQTFNSPAAATAPLPVPMAATPTSANVPRPITGSAQPSGSGLQSVPLEELSRKLAVYIGPVAKFVVKKLAAQHEDLDTIYREAAKQISSESDRAAFLRSKGK
jgi:serine/threonine-protein kinase